MSACPHCGRAEGHADSCPAAPTRAATTDTQRTLASGLSAGPARSPGDLLANRYRLGRELGAGGYGIVHAAVDERTGEEVAVKLLHAGEKRGGFLQEVEILCRLRHPNIVSLLDAGEHEGAGFLVMELVEGGCLDEPMRAGRLPVADVLEAGEAVAAALDQVHAEGILHRDIKPANVLLADNAIAKLSDFGIAEAMRFEGREAETEVAGTLHYLAPELFRGKPPSVASDLYALGVLLYQGLTGEVPYSGNSVGACIDSILQAKRAPLTETGPDLPEDLAGLVDALLAKDPAARPASAAETGGVLAQVLARGGAEAESSRIPMRLALSVFRPPAGGERRRSPIVRVQIKSGAGFLDRESGSDLRALLFRTAERFGARIASLEDDAAQVVFGLPRIRERDPARAIDFAGELLDGCERLGGGTALACVIHRCAIEGDTQARTYGIRKEDEDRAADLAVATPGGELRLTAEAVAAHRNPGRFEKAPDLSAAAREAGGIYRVRTGDVVEEPLAPLCGRDKELKEVLAALDTANGGIFTIIGRAGIGKTRVLREVVYQLRQKGRRTSWIATDTRTGAAPYALVREIVQELGREGSLEIPEVLQSLRGDRAGEDRLAQLSSSQLSIAIRTSLTEVFEQCAASGGWTFFVEDLHWLDQASVELLGGLLPALRETGVWIVTSTRPSCQPDWLTEEGAHTLDLKPLDEVAQVQLLKEVTGRAEIPDGIVREFLRRASGRPLHLLELARAAREAGEIPDTMDPLEIRAYLDGLELPDSLEALIRSRADRLDPLERQFACAAAVMGREFDLDAVAHLLGRSRDQTEPVNRRLQGSGFLESRPERGAGIFAFSHDLVQEVVYGGMSEEDLRPLHGLAAEWWLRAEGVEAGRPAYHLYRSANPKAALPYLRESIDLSRRVRDITACLRQTEEALSLLRDPQTQEEKEILIEVHFHRFRVLEETGDHEEASVEERTLIRAARSAGDRALLEQVHLDLHRFLQPISTERAEPHLKALESLVQESVGGSTNARVLLRRIHKCLHEGRREDARALIRQPIGLDRLTPLEQQEALRLLGWIEYEAYEIEAALEHWEKGLRLAEADRRVGAQLDFQTSISTAHFGMAQYERASVMASSGWREARKHGLVYQFIGLRINDALCKAALGEESAALLDLGACLEEARRAGLHWETALLHLYTARLLFRSGAYSEIQSECEKLREQVENHGQQRLRANLEILLIELLLGLGSTVEAGDRLASLRREFDVDNLREDLRVWALRVEAKLFRCERRTEAALRAASHLEGIARNLRDLDEALPARIEALRIRALWNPKPDCELIASELIECARASGRKYDGACASTAASELHHSLGDDEAARQLASTSVQSCSNRNWMEAEWEASAALSKACQSHAPDLAIETAKRASLLLTRIADQIHKHEKHDFLARPDRAGWLGKTRNTNP